MMPMAETLYLLKFPSVIKIVFFCFYIGWRMVPLPVAMGRGVEWLYVTRAESAMTEFYFVRLPPMFFY